MTRRAAPVRFFLGSPLFVAAALASTPSTAEPSHTDPVRAVARERIRDSMVFVLGDETRVGALQANPLTKEQWNAVRRLVAAMIEDDGVLDLVIDAPPHRGVTKTEAVRTFLRALVDLRAAQIQGQLTDDDLDEAESVLSPWLLKRVCPSAAAVTPDVAVPGEETFPTRTLEIFARGWEAFNHHTAPPRADDADLRDALAQLLGNPETAALMVDAHPVQSTDTLTVLCDRQLAARRRAIAALPKRQRVAMYRVSIKKFDLRAVATSKPRAAIPDDVEDAAPPTNGQRTFRFADLTVDLDDDSSIARAFAIDPSPRLLPRIRRLLNALVANPVMKPRLASATDPDAPQTFKAYVDTVNLIATQLFAHGLGRVHDATLLRIRPILSKVARVQTADRCAALVTALVFPFPGVQLSAEEQASTLDAWSRSVEAINSGQPNVEPTEAEIDQVTEEVASSLSEEELAGLGSSLGEADKDQSCDEVKLNSLIRLSQTTRSTALIRDYAKAYTALLLRPVRGAIGDSPRTPSAGWAAHVHGEQTVLITVDSAGRVTDAKVKRSVFVPERVFQIDGSEEATSVLYDREIEVWIRQRTYPPKLKDGQPVGAEYEIPITWKLRE